MGLDAQGYYSLRQILSYKAKYNIILSDRGRGKTWGIKHFLYRQQGTFMCLFRDSQDVLNSVPDWCDQLIASKTVEAEDVVIEGDKNGGYEMFFGGSETAKAYFRPLTGVNHIKHEWFPDDLNWVFWDEFVPLKQTKLAGIDSEGDALRTILKTIDHDSVKSREQRGLKPLRVIMTANPNNWSCPTLSYFRIDPSMGYGIHKIHKDIVCEYLEPVEMNVDKTQNVEDFLGVSIHRADAWKGQLSFIAAIPKGSVPVRAYRFNDSFFVELSDNVGRCYIKKSNDSEYSQIAVPHYGGVEGLRKGELPFYSGARYLQVLKERARGGFTYPDLNTKFDFLNGLETI